MPANPPTPEQRERALKIVRGLLGHHPAEGEAGRKFREGRDAILAFAAAEFARGHAAGQEQMRGALKKYGRHTSACALTRAESAGDRRDWDGADATEGKPCDCGLALAIEPAKEE